MIGLSKMTYATCPECKYELNNNDYVPLTLLQSPSRSIRKVNCPNKICGKPFYLIAKLELTLEGIPLDEVTDR